jgi:hypothetical protein
LIVKSFNSLWFSSIEGHQLTLDQWDIYPRRLRSAPVRRWAVVASLAVAVR